MPRLMDLPGEILGHILTYLDPPCIARWRRVCKVLQKVASQEIILRRVCQRLGYLGPHEHLEDLRSAPHSRAKETEDATRLADSHVYPAYKIAGRQESEYQSYAAFLNCTWLLGELKDKPDLVMDHPVKFFECSGTSGLGGPWSFAIDHVEDVAIVTDHLMPGLRTVCMKTGKQLCRLTPQSSPLIRPGSRVEYSDGWVVTWNAGDCDASLGPSNWYLRIWCFQRNDPLRHPSTAPRRGRLVHKGHICPEDLFDSVRFQFPYLAVGSYPATKAELYDVTTKELIRSISFHGPAGRPWLCTSLDFDDDFVWVSIAGSRDPVTNARRSQLDAYCRHSGRLIWRLCHDHPIIANAPTFVLRCKAEQEECDVRPGWMRRASEQALIDDECAWKYVRLDRKTDCLVLLDIYNQSRLILIPNCRNFDPSLQKIISLHFVEPYAQRSLKDHCSANLTARDGRVAFLTYGQEVAVVNLEALLTCFDQMTRTNQLSGPKQGRAEDLGNGQRLECSQAALSSIAASVNLYRPHTLSATAYECCAFVLTPTMLAMAMESNELEAMLSSAAGSSGRYSYEKWPELTEPTGIVMVDFGEAARDRSASGKLAEKHRTAEAKMAASTVETKLERGSRTPEDVAVATSP